MHLLSLWTSVALMISLVVSLDDNLSRYCDGPKYFDYDGDKSCKPCKDRFPIKPGFEFTPNCGLDDFGNSLRKTYQECKNGTYNNGEFDVCEQCRTCQADVERIICSTTHDTLCCAPGKWIESGLCPPYCSERNQQMSRSSLCPKTHFNCKQVEGQPCRPEQEITLSITVNTTIQTQHSLELTTNEIISEQTTTPVLTEQTTTAVLTEQTTTPVLTEQTAKTNLEDKSYSNTVALSICLTLAILLILLVIFCVYKCWAKMKAAPKKPSLHFCGGQHLDQVHQVQQPLMMPQANGLHRDDSVDKIDIKDNDVNCVHQNHLPMESASEQVLQKLLMMPQENRLHRNNLIDKIHMEVNGEPVSLPLSDNSLNEILGSELHTAPLQTVLNNLDVLEELIMLLDPEISNTKSTKHLASRCQFPSTWINYTYSMKDSKSPLKVLLEAVSAKWPDWTVGQLAVMLSDMERNDAVKVLTKLSPIQQEVL